TRDGGRIVGSARVIPVGRTAGRAAEIQTVAEEIRIGVKGRTAATASISLTLPSDAPAMIEVFDVRGRRILSRDILRPRSHSEQKFSLAGVTIGAGEYFVRVRQAPHSMVTKFTLFR